MMAAGPQLAADLYRLAQQRLGFGPALFREHLPKAIFDAHDLRFVRRTQAPRQAQSLPKERLGFGVPALGVKQPREREEALARVRVSRWQRSAAQVQRRAE